MSEAGNIRRWKRPPFIKNPTLRWAIWVGAAIYLALAMGTMEINWERVAEGMERGHRFVMAFFPPDFVSRWDSIEACLKIKETVLATDEWKKIWANHPDPDGYIQYQSRYMEGY